jgi:hypothetical protein
LGPALLAIAFLAHGWLFLSPPAELVDQLNAPLPRWFQLFLGVAEVLAAVGLTLPGLARIQPSLVISAAAGIMIVMVSATVFHLARGEMSSAAITLVLFGIATFVAYMRYRVVPIPARGAGNALSADRQPVEPAGTSASGASTTSQQK